MNEDERRLERCLKVHPDAVLFEESLWDGCPPMLRCCLCLYPPAAWPDELANIVYTVPNTRMPYTWLVNVKAISPWDRSKRA